MNGFDLWKVIGSLLTAVLGSFATLLINAINYSLQYKRRSALSFLKGKEWETTWFVGEDEVYVRDVVTFDKYVWFGKIKGHGKMTSPDTNGTNREYIYPITFEVSRTNVVTFKYFAQRYPIEGLMGTGCGVFSINGREISGGWTGVVNRERFNKPVVHGRFLMVLKS